MLCYFGVLCTDAFIEFAYFAHINNKVTAAITTTVATVLYVCYTSTTDAFIDTTHSCHQVKSEKEIVFFVVVVAIPHFVSLSLSLNFLELDVSAQYCSIDRVCRMEFDFRAIFHRCYIYVWWIWK